MSIFKHDDKNLKQIFREYWFSFPKYQRLYSWGEEQISQLFSDIKDAYETNPKKPFFIGSIVVCKNKKNDYKEVIDGQQRLTTLAILTALLSGQTKIKEKTTDGGYTISRENLKDMLKKNKIKVEYKITPNNKPATFHNFIENCINQTDEFINYKKPTNAELKQEGNVLAKYINTLKIFEREIETIKNLQKFTDFIYNQVTTIIIECEERSSALKVFQILNDRGMPLTASDIIKTYFIDECHKQHSSEEYLDQNWNELRDALNEKEVSLDTFFTMFLYYKIAQNPKESLEDSFKKHILKVKKFSVQKTIKDLNNFATFYPDPNYNIDKIKKSIKAKKLKYIYSLYYLSWGMYINSIIMTIFMSNYKEKEKLLKIIRDFYYKYYIAGATLNAIKQISFNLIKWIKDKKTLKEIEKSLEKKILDDKIEKNAKDNITEDNLKGERFIKPLLLSLEYSSTDTDYFIDLNRSVQIEHIFPIDSSKWAKKKVKELRPYLWSLGNLTLLKDSKNSKIKNNTFNKKKKEYKNSCFDLTKEIANNYKDWNEKYLNKRKDELLKMVIEEFNFISK